MKNNIIIAGVPRAGKSTLSHLLSTRYGYQHISMDTIIAGFEKCFPETGVNTYQGLSSMDTLRVISGKMAPFVRAMLDSAEYDEFEPGMVLDMYQLLPEDYDKYIRGANCEIIYLITSDVTPEERFLIQKKYDTEKDYTFYKSDEELRAGAGYIVEQSKLMKEQCEKYHIPYYETAHDRDKVIQKLIDEQIESPSRGGKLTGSHFRAVVFDLFETLITEWGHEKYTKRQMCNDLGIDKDRFDVFWKEKEEERYLGKIDFKGSILYAGSKLGEKIDSETLSYVLNRRIAAKATCFEQNDTEIFHMLETIKKLGLRTAIVSNCSSEEVKVIRESELYKYFDEVVLSYEVHMKKPDCSIYEETARRLGVEPEDCIFVGDGGSNELQGAKNAGMKAIQAKWYTNRFPQKRETIEDFPVAESPLEVVPFLHK